MSFPYEKKAFIDNIKNLSKNDIEIITLDGRNYFINLGTNTSDYEELSKHVDSLRESIKQLVNVTKYNNTRITYSEHSVLWLKLKFEMVENNG